MEEARKGLKATQSQNGEEKSGNKELIKRSCKVQACLGEILAPCCTSKCIHMHVVKEKAFSLLLGHVLLPVDVGSGGWNGLLIPCSLTGLGAFLTLAAAAGSVQNLLGMVIPKLLEARTAGTPEDLRVFPTSLPPFRSLRDIAP